MMAMRGMDWAGRRVLHTASVETSLDTARTSACATLQVGEAIFPVAASRVHAVGHALHDRFDSLDYLSMRLQSSFLAALRGTLASPHTFIVLCWVRFVIWPGMKPTALRPPLRGRSGSRTPCRQDRSRHYTVRARRRL